MSSNPVYGEVCSIQHYVIKLVSDLWQIGGFLRVLLFPPPINWLARYNWNIVEIILAPSLMCMVFMPTEKAVVLARYVILYRTGMPRHHIFPELLKTTVSFPYIMFIEVTEKQKKFHLEIEKTPLITGWVIPSVLIVHQQRYHHNKK